MCCVSSCNELLPGTDLFPDIPNSWADIEEHSTPASIYLDTSTIQHLSIDTKLMKSNSFY